MPKAYEAKPLKALKAAVDARWPNRDRTSDGWIGDEAHQARTSAHNPDPRTGVVRARDLDVDGIVPAVVVASGMLHPSVRYIIHNRRIFRSADRWRPRVYDGSNPHTGHIHTEIWATQSAELSSAEWQLIDGFKWPELRPGDTGPNVKALQALLNAHGASLVVDGNFGTNTTNAVVAFQQRRKLYADALVGPRTQAALAS